MSKYWSGVKGLAKISMYNLDFFYYMNGIRNQIKILKSKGLHFNNVKKAKEKLKDEGFYNIINAFKPLFLDKNNKYH